MATIKTIGIVEVIEPLSGVFIAAIGYPPVGLQQDGGPEIPIAIPPIARATSLAAEAQDALP